MPVGLSDGTSYPDEGEYIASTMPLTPSTLAQDALKSQGGTRVPGKVSQLDSTRPDLPNIEDVPHHDWVESMAKSAFNAFALPGDVLSGKVKPNSPQEIERAMDLAGLMVFGPAPVASKMADGTLGSFIGVKAKTFDKARLTKAQELESAGKSADDIWNELGTYRDKSDNRWKQEVSDKDAKLTDRDWHSYDEGKLSEFFDHPELYKAYPHLKDVNLNIDSMYPGIASFNEGTNTLTINPRNKSDDVLLDIIIHEIQHKIQAYEGFSYGSNPAYELRRALSAVSEKRRAFEEAYDKPNELEMSNLYQDIMDNSSKFGDYMYTRVPGEIEANLSMARRQLTDEQRRMMSPEQMQDFLVNSNSINNITGGRYRQPFNYPE